MHLYIALLLPIVLLFKISASQDVSTITIDVRKPIAFSSSRFVSYNFDWHKNSEEPPLWINCSVQTLNLTNIALLTSVRGMATRLRIGGSEEDDIVYNVNGNECTDLKTDPAFCLNMDRWQEIVSFTTTNDIDLVFGLNAMVRKNNKSPENFTNIIAFLNYTFLHKLSVYGWEFGNELEESSIDATTDGHDFVKLYGIIQSIWNNTGNAPANSVPKLIGNDLNPNPTYLQTFLPIVREYLDVMTYHNYDGYGLDTNLTNEIITPQFLDKTWNNIKGVYSAYLKYANTDKTEIWLGEAAAAWHSGQDNCTNSFVSSFWYCDAFGTLTLLNHTGFCRQTLIGGAYGLLNRVQPYIPNPDYYSAKLYHDLAGDSILNVTMISDNYNGYLRAYAHCSRKTSGDIGVLLINILAETAVNVNLSVIVANGNNEIEGLNVYKLTADSLNSRTVKMNGKVLEMNADMTKLPCLSDCPVIVNGNSVINVEPYSIVFVDVKMKNKVGFCT